MPMSPRLLRPRSTLHPEAAAWRTAVVANGGTVSGSTLLAVSKFCADIDKYALRTRFARLNLICGDSLSAALVPLYRGPSPTGTQYGNAADGYNAFVGLGTDYAETGSSGGLTGNGSSKYLDTTVSPDGINARTNAHVSVYHSQPSGGNQTRVWIGGRDTVTASNVYLSNGIFSTSAVYGQWLGNATANFNTGGSQTGAAAGHRLLSRTATNVLVNYYNAVSQTTGSTDITGGISGVTASRPLFVFASNNQGTAEQWINGRILAYSIGYGMTQQQVTDFYTAMQAFQTALNRNL